MYKCRRFFNYVFFNLPSFNIKIFESAFYISLSSYDSAKSADEEV